MELALNLTVIISLIFNLAVERKSVQHCQIWAKQNKNKQTFDFKNPFSVNCDWSFQIWGQACFSELSKRIILRLFAIKNCISKIDCHSFGSTVWCNQAGNLIWKDSGLYNYNLLYN
jgi:hypothetical protein